jgi:hypothetical protein
MSNDDEQPQVEQPEQEQDDDDTDAVDVPDGEDPDEIDEAERLHVEPPTERDDLDREEARDTGEE